MFCVMLCQRELDRLVNTAWNQELLKFCYACSNISAAPKITIVYISASPLIFFACLLTLYCAFLNTVNEDVALHSNG